MRNSVTLVDEHDKMYGTMDKMAAHRCGKLHRAVSVFIFNSNGDMLIQQRALNKYHSGGLWSNACCSHPHLGEPVPVAAKRRLHEEMGVTAELHFSFHFVYNEAVGRGLIEYEFDHVFTGVCDAEPVINQTEVAGFRYIPLTALETELKEHPQHLLNGSRSVIQKQLLPIG